MSPKMPEAWLTVRMGLFGSPGTPMMVGREAVPVGTKSGAPARLEPAEVTALIKQQRKSFALLGRCRILV